MGNVSPEQAVSIPPGTAEVQTAEADADEVRGLRWELTDDQRAEIRDTVLASLRSIGKQQPRHN
jgi:hypothetical protein